MPRSSGVSEPEDEKVVALREAVHLAIPLLVDGAHALADGGNLEMARRLTHARRMLARAVDRWMADTQPIDEADMPKGDRG